jgi:CDP-diacylglycerol--serine O-phosphatidyltransferase
MSRIQPLRQHLPNLLTLCNLAIGFLSIIMALENQLLFASWLILLAGLFDFLDGFAAKMLGAISEFGKQLDSLADIVSFGMAPAAIVYKLMEYALMNKLPLSGLTDANFLERIYLYSPMLLVLFAAIRLAAFNIQDNQEGFTGLATPAAAIFFAGLCMVVISHPQSGFTNFLLKPNHLIMIILMISILMILRIPMFSLKFPGFGWKGNEIRYLFIAVFLILLIILQEIALPVIILVYLLLSFISLLSKTNNR